VTTFPGGTSLTRLAVYAEHGGTPHLHTVSTEAYVVVGGSGLLQTVDSGGLRETPLSAGTTVWFPPGTVHRAVNHGDLDVVVIMSNAGLPEAGDAVMTFPVEVVADPERYRAAARLEGDPDQAVRRRRELALEGFARLAEAAEKGDPEPLEQFYDAAAALVRPSLAGWRAIVEAAADRAVDMVGSLERGDGSHLRRSGVRTAAPSDPRRWGMCGRLGAYDVTKGT
jgi:mannose-6-phosphate isomerase-like protein (cupin superfamily)